MTNNERASSRCGCVSLAAGALEDAAVGGVPHGEPPVADDALLHHGHELAVVDAAVLLIDQHEIN